jgi:hypothetical protein
VLLFGLQTGVAPVHCDAFVAEHWAQAPLLVPVLRQAGRFGSVHPPDGPSAVQATQLLVVPSHRGDAFEQFTSAVQPTQ